jgi:hypothetical protein
MSTAAATCDRTTSVTRSLLGYGVIAGPFYVIVSLGQALTRTGFDLSRHEWSLLANGSLGWIQIVNFLLTGAMIVAFAVGLRRADQGRWAPRLIAVYGLGMVGAGIFRADPSLGFPPGTPDGPGAVSWHGLLHFVCAGIGFGCMIAACLVMAHRFARASSDGRSTSVGDRGWAGFSAVTGVAFLGAFIGVASSGSGNPALIYTFIAAVVLVFAWISALAVRLYRTV